MGHFSSKLAREVGRLTGEKERIFGRCYRAIAVSDEEAAQLERLARRRNPRRSRWFDGIEAEARARREVQNPLPQPQVPTSWRRQWKF
jgi:hypothetical protein